MSLTKVTPALTGEYKTVGALLASTEASRGVGAIWEAGGFRYTEVAASGDITTAGSIQLDVLASASGEVVPEQWGAVGDNSTDVTTKIQAAITYAVANGVTLKFNKLASGASSLYKISTVLSITGAINIEGHGRGYSGIVCVGCSGFLISAGANFVNISGIGIFQSVRHTVTPNAYKAIETQGTTGSRNFWHTYDNIFIDGFHTAFFVSYLWSTQITNINTVFGMNGIHSVGLSVNNNVTNCQFSGDSSVGSVGIRIGDGTISTEGWMITDNLFAFFEVGAWAYGCSNSHLKGNIIDFFAKRGVLLQSTATAGATNWNISDNYMACSGTGSTGVFLLNNYAAGSAGYRGTVLHGNDILAYSGSTLAFGIVQEGTEEINNSITSNKVDALGGVACKIIAGVGTVVSNNTWKTGIFTALVAGQYLNNTGVSSGVYPHSEGSFVPTIIGTSAAGVGTYSAQVGRFKIVDNMVFFDAELTWSAHTGTGAMKVSLGNLPTSLNLANYFPAITVFAENIVFPGATTQIQGGINASTRNVELRATGNGIGPTAVAMDSAGRINVSGFYEIA
tara:strand:+ start:19 stop:1710 length:1692 start_codon:yes stop_codon:yes gene_type:complete